MILPLSHSQDCKIFPFEKVKKNGSADNEMLAFNNMKLKNGIFNLENPIYNWGLRLNIQLEELNNKEAEDNDHDEGIGAYKQSSDNVSNTRTWAFNVLTKLKSNEIKKHRQTKTKTI